MQNPRRVPPLFRVFGTVSWPVFRLTLGIHALSDLFQPPRPVCPLGHVALRWPDATIDLYSQK